MVLVVDVMLYLVSKDRDGMGYNYREVNSY